MPIRSRAQIRIGGVDLRAMTSEQLNRLISVVFQDVYLFNDTLLENLLIARPNATMAEVEAAARSAQCMDFISRLPQGWQTPIGEMGARLSGGEQQRISIARALLKNAPIVILDEPTAALDIESELAVQRAIDHLVQDKTVLIIAHRLTTIAAAGRIFVIDDGQLKEQGSHEALLASGGQYDAMWQAQQSDKHWRVPQAEKVRGTTHTRGRFMTHDRSMLNRLPASRLVLAVIGIYMTQSLISTMAMQSVPALVRAAGGSLTLIGASTVFMLPGR
ncbi:ATP-binding cassette domain-containing protein [Vibrio sp. PP-XX7]